jgi:hypothetical protein
MKRALAAVLLAPLVAAPLAAHPTDEVASAPDQIHPLLIGAQVPELTVKAGDGSDFDLNAALGKKRTILIFYRGGW